jgi:hypothetical protein
MQDVSGAVSRIAMAYVQEVHEEHRDAGYFPLSTRVHCPAARGWDRIPPGGCQPPENLRGRCVSAIEQYHAEYGTEPNALVIDTTGQIIAGYQTG